MTNLKTIYIARFVTSGSVELRGLPVSFELFGQPIGQAPIVLINHALTGNSNCADPETGWWRQVIGENKVIDTNRLTVIAFNVPGNGYDGFRLTDPKCLTGQDVARLFIHALDRLNVDKLDILIGGSVGGGIAWEMLIQRPDLTNMFIPIATSWQSTPWIRGVAHTQSMLLKLSDCSVAPARQQAMLFYRTPQSFDVKFTPERTAESWLDHHGQTLDERFTYEAYQTMNHLLASIDCPNNPRFERTLKALTCPIHQITISSDILFHPEVNERIRLKLKECGKDTHIHTIQSIHGHDAFLMEYDQLNAILKPLIQA